MSARTFWARVDAAREEREREYTGDPWPAGVSVDELERRGELTRERGADTRGWGHMSESE